MLGTQRVLGGLTPAEYARRLREKVITMPGKLQTEPLLKIGGTSAPGRCLERQRTDS